MEAKLQRRVQRYGWDLAVQDYEPLWGAQLAPARAALLQMAALTPGERVLDVACGTGLVSFAAAAAVGPEGAVLGVDISGEMVEAANRRAALRGVWQAAFVRQDAEVLDLPQGAGFDAALCALGLMYLPDPEAALAGVRRLLRPGGRIAVAVWGERAACGWAPVFEIVDAEVASDVCPLFFRLGQGEALPRALARAGFEPGRALRLGATLHYPTVGTACDAAFLGGPVALAWSRFDEAARVRARAAYAAAIARWRRPDGGYDLPGEFVVATARVPG